MRQRVWARNRGQLLVVTALVISVLFVSLAVILNSGIYAENLSTRSTSNTADVQSATTQTFGTIDTMVDKTNAHHNSSYEALTGNYTKMTSDFQEVKGDEYATRGISFNLTTPDQTNGTYLRQTDQTRNFTNATGEASDWQVAGSVTGVSDYEMTVNRNDLYTEDDDAPNELLENSSSVNITDENGAVWELHVYENSNNNVTVKPVVNGNEMSSCEVEAAEVTIDLVAGTVGGDPCPTLTFAEGLDGTLDIEYRDPDEIGGTYSLRVDTKIDPATTDSYVEPGSGSPSATPTIYATTPRITCADSDSSVTTERRIVAGDVAYAASSTHG